MNRAIVETYQIPSIFSMNASNNDNFKNPIPFNKIDTQNHDSVEFGHI